VVKSHLKLVTPATEKRTVTPKRRPMRAYRTIQILRWRCKAVQKGGYCRPHRSLRETFDRFIAAFKFVDRQILSEVVEADRAAVHSRLTVQYNDKTRTTECLDLFKFQDGKIIELTEFADTALIQDLMSGATESRGAP
jgi:hypothetical protein